MPQQLINIGFQPGDGQGDTPRAVGEKLNAMMAELYAGIELSPARAAQAATEAATTAIGPLLAAAQAEVLQADTINSPARRLVPVVPSDGADLAQLPKGLFVGGAGNLSLVMEGGVIVALTGVQAGSLLPIRPLRVRATGTTATSIVALV